jgi:hypothetical protein
MTIPRGGRIPANAGGLYTTVKLVLLNSNTSRFSNSNTGRLYNSNSKRLIYVIILLFTTVYILYKGPWVKTEAAISIPSDLLPY